MQLVILAGGKGTRLGLTDIPKPMIKIDGIPLLEYQIELAKRYGIKDIFILSGYLANVIFDYFGDGHKWGVKIEHIVEPRPLGTAGSLKLIADRLTDRFLVFYGDIVMDFDIKAFVDFDKKNSDAIATLFVHPNNHPYDSDLVDVDDEGNVESFISKPHAKDLIYKNLVNAAVYILSPKILDFIESDTMSDFGKDIFPRVLTSGGRIRAYSTSEYVKDIGTKDRFPKICKDVASGKVRRLNKENLRKCIFIDRDGVINKNMDTNISFESFELLEGVSEAISLINASDYLCIIVTNQPMIAKGFLTFQELKKIHNKMETSLGKDNAFIDRIYYCPHHPQKGFKGEVEELKIDCQCRKPKVGMFVQAQKEFNIDFNNSWMIGDSNSDILAGKKIGCRTIYINNSVEKSEDADFNKENLLDAVKSILG